MNIENIPTPETDRAEMCVKHTHRILFDEDKVVESDKARDLERRLTVARDALKRCDPGEHDYPIPSDAYDGAVFCEISVGDIRAIREALTLTAPKS